METSVRLQQLVNNQKNGIQIKDQTELFTQVMRQLEKVDIPVLTKNLVQSGLNLSEFVKDLEILQNSINGNYTYLKEQLKALETDEVSFTNQINELQQYAISIKKIEQMYADQIKAVILRQIKARILAVKDILIQQYSMYSHKQKIIEYSNIIQGTTDIKRRLQAEEKLITHFQFILLNTNDKQQIFRDTIQLLVKLIMKNSLQYDKSILDLDKQINFVVVSAISTQIRLENIAQFKPFIQQFCPKEYLKLILSHLVKQIQTYHDDPILQYWSEQLLQNIFMTNITIDINQVEFKFDDNAVITQDPYITNSLDIKESRLRHLYNIKTFSYNKSVAKSDEFIIIKDFFQYQLKNNMEIDIQQQFNRFIDSYFSNLKTKFQLQNYYEADTTGFCMDIVGFQMCLSFCQILFLYINNNQRFLCNLQKFVNSMQNIICHLSQIKCQQRATSIQNIIDTLDSDIQTTNNVSLKQLQYYQIRIISIVDAILFIQQTLNQINLTRIKEIECLDILIERYITIILRKFVFVRYDFSQVTNVFMQVEAVVMQFTNSLVQVMGGKKSTPCVKYLYTYFFKLLNEYIIAGLPKGSDIKPLLNDLNRVHGHVQKLGLVWPGFEIFDTFSSRLISTVV